MLFLVKLFPEITIKTRTVRWRLIRQLRKNIRSVLSEFDPAVSAVGEWDNLEIQTSTEDPAIIAQISESLTCTPGIAKFMQVDKYPRTDLDAMLGSAGFPMPAHALLKARNKVAKVLQLARL